MISSSSLSKKISIQKANTTFTIIISAAVIAAVLVMSTIWMGRKTSVSTHQAVSSVSEFYLHELAGRRGQVVSANLNATFSMMKAALAIIEPADLKDEQSLRKYLWHVKTVCSWDVFAIEDINHNIYRSLSTEHDTHNYTFLDKGPITAPSIFTVKTDNDNAKAFLAIPVEDLSFNNTPLSVCFIQLDIKSMLKGIAMQNTGHEATFCNLYNKDGTALTDIVLGGVSNGRNLLDALAEADFLHGCSLDKIKKDFSNGIGGLISFMYQDTQESLYYIPVRNTDWMLTYLIKEQKIDDQITSISQGILKRSLIQIILAVLITIGMFMLIFHMNEKTRATEVERNVAAAQNKAKSDFLSNMSHDIRTPMNAITGFTNLALRSVDDKDKIKEYLEKIQISSNHLLSLINDVLEMSRIENGKIELDEQPCNLPEILHDINAIVLAQVEAKQQELHMDALNITDENILCDKLRLNQVLINLLSNAVKYTPSGGKINIRIIQNKNETLPQGWGDYEIRVKDNGIGMSKEFSDKIFDAFERERNSTISNIQGTGLGMAITKKIVDLMGGTITVNTEQGKGSEFTVKVRFRIVESTPVPQKIVELNNIRALVVDDDFDTCDSTTKMLALMGMRPEWTLSGKEAVLRAKQAQEMGNGYGVFIIDWRLGEINGIDVAARIRSQLGDNTPILLMTAYDWPAIKDEAIAAGVDAFCNKPLFMSDLHRALQRVIGNAETNKDDENNAETEAQRDANFEGKRLLLVDDVDVNREIAVMLLEMHGFIVEQAANGQEAIDKVTSAQAHYYDAILMDVQMPVMDGYTATRAIRTLADAAKSSVPIIAMTANAFEEDKRNALDAGMNAHIAKPIDENNLVNVLEKILCEKSE